MLYSINPTNNLIGLIFCIISPLLFCIYLIFLLTSQKTKLFNLSYTAFNNQAFVKTKINTFILLLIGLGYVYITIFKYFPEFKIFTNGVSLQFNGKLLIFELILILLFCILLYLSLSYRSELKKEHILFFFFFIFPALNIVFQNNLIGIFLLLEMLSLAGYIIVTALGNKISIEGGLKYALIGVFSSALLIIALILFFLYYGTFDLSNIFLLENYSYIDTTSSNIYILFCCIFFLISLFFKLAIVPFHQWILDVYKSASNLSFLWLVTATKTILFFVILIVFENILQKNSENLKYIFIFAGIFSVFIGTFGGLIQTNIKGLFAFSSIVTIGFIIINFIYFFDNPEKASALSFIYLMTYIFNILSFFFFLSKIQQKSLLFGNLKYINNIIKIDPIIGFGLVINFFSLLGLPPLIGFLPKILIFLKLYQEQYYFICIFYIFCSLVSGFYYFKIIKRISLFQKTELTFNETYNLLNIYHSNFFEKIISIFLILLNIVLIIKFQYLYEQIEFLLK
jgi:NADH-quinone oxidoreductase subunit N